MKEGACVKLSLKTVIIAHGMLGSASNWSSIAKNVHRKTGLNIIIFDARNHGRSEHTQSMTYQEMAEDTMSIIKQQPIELNGDKGASNEKRPVVLVGHSMGGRTCMYTALSRPDLVEALVVVDVSPVNQRFNLEDGSEWNMDHFFHAMKAVKFLQPSDIQDWTLPKVKHWWLPSYFIISKNM